MQFWTIFEVTKFFSGRYVFKFMNILFLGRNTKMLFLRYYGISFLLCSFAAQNLGFSSHSPAFWPIFFIEHYANNTHGISASLLRTREVIWHVYQQEEGGWTCSCAAFKLKDHHDIKWFLNFKPILRLLKSYWSVEPLLEKSGFDL